MCKFCNNNSDYCCIFIDPLDNQYYLDVETSTWDEYNDGFIHQREYINYCPYCGKKLNDTNQSDVLNRDIEIINMFCKQSDVHGEDLKKILRYGYCIHMIGEENI